MWKCPICETNNEDQKRICEVCGARRDTPASASTVIIGGEPASMRSNAAPASRPEPQIPDSTALLEKKLSRRNAVIAIIAIIAVAAAGLAVWFFARPQTPLELRVDVLNADRIDGVWYVGEIPAHISWSSGRSNARYNVSLNDPSGAPIRYYENTTMTELEVAQSDLTYGDSCALILTAIDGKESTNYRVILSGGVAEPTEAPTEEPTAEPTAEPTPEHTPEPTYEVTAPEITVTGYESYDGTVYYCADDVVTVEWKSEGDLSHYNVYVYDTNESSHMVSSYKNTLETIISTGVSHWTENARYTIIVEAVSVNGTYKSSNITLAKSDIVVSDKEPISDTTIIEFADENLADAIREELGISGDITYADLQDLIYLAAPERDIESLVGLEYCTNMTKLYLYDNQISDISPLASLSSLTYLRLDYNQISDISPLASLSSLTDLYLAYNQISDISPLASLSSLTFLYLNGNQISDISHLASLSSLTDLYLSFNQISDISPLASLSSLTDLYLSYNQISDISPLASLSSLTVLSLSSNQISDISSLASLSSLTDLRLWYNQISDISHLASLSSLTYLDLDNNQISDISHLASLSSLTYLDLYGNQISDISPLAGLTDLEELYIDEYEIENMDAISHLDCDIN